MDELKEFLSGKREALAGAMANAKTPDEAYWAACQYRALAAFVSEANASIAVGDRAVKELLERG
ncbi:MAG: hypothetical protein LBQ42_12515 [Synergistaceae bacterium]|nr:hypothetical protein [Synergistaceae bacterium]